MEDVQRVFQTAEEKLGGIDILVNNVAVETDGVMDGDIEKMQYTVQTNIFGYIACSHEALKRMKDKKSGHIVNIGSMSADARESGGDVYVATKAAIQGFSGSLRKSANKEGTRVTLIEPGLVVSDMVDLPEDEEQEKRKTQEILPPEDIAECVHYCLTQPQRCDVVEVRIRPLQQLI